MYSRSVGEGETHFYHAMWIFFASKSSSRLVGQGRESYFFLFLFFSPLSVTVLHFVYMDVGNW